MKIRASKEILQKGIAVVQNAVSSRATLPILSNILLTTIKNEAKLAIIGTDLDIGMSTAIEVTVLEEGGGTIPAKRFGDIIKELPDGEVTITMKKNNLFVIEGPNCTFKIIGLPKEEFPKLPTFTNDPSITLDQKDMREMLHMTSFAMSHDETRYVLNGLFIALEADGLTFVATDGRRLALIKRKIDTNKVCPTTNIIPIKTVQELQRLLTDEGEIIITFNDNQTQFELNNTRVISRLIEGEFPNYQQVIPKEAKEKIKIGRLDFLSAIRRANLLTTQESLAVKINITPQKMIVSKTTPEIGELKEEVSVRYNGDEMSIGFNPAYLLDILKSSTAEEIAFEITGPDKPGVIRFPEYVYIVLPMQL